MPKDFAMKHALAALVLLALLALPLAAHAETPGTIHFEDGTSVEFFDMVDFDGEDDGVPVYFENSFRKVPFDKMRSLRIASWEFKKSVLCCSTRAVVETVTGVRAEYTLEQLHGDKWGGLRVKLLDKLTGEITTQYFEFDKRTDSGTALNIREITFGGE
jgi:hypothetical protein